MAEVVRSNFSVLLPLIEDCINRSEFLGKERSLKAKRKGVKEERERGSSLGTRGSGSEGSGSKTNGSVPRPPNPSLRVEGAM